jgi:hypothetical protein
MGNLIEHGDSADGQVVRVGETESPVSIKVYQDIYHQITGRTEQIRKRYSENLLIEFGEIEQLHHKIMQLCDVHRVIARNETVSIFHEKERKEQFTSFDRFRAYNANAVSPSLSVVLKYNFSIVPGGLQRPQEYVVTIRLTSRVGIINQLDKDGGPPYFMLGFLGDDVAEITLDYTDYIVARGFLEACDEWIRGCKSLPPNRALKFVRRHSHLIREYAPILAASLVIAFSLGAVPDFFGPSSSPQTWARFLIIFGGGGFILGSLMLAAARMIENAIDNYPILSYLKLNKGDAKLIEEFAGRQKREWLKFIGGSVLAIVLGVLSSKLERWI